jgi:hypothetical protein
LHITGGCGGEEERGKKKGGEKKIENREKRYDSLTGGSHLQ